MYKVYFAFVGRAFLKYVKTDKMNGIGKVTNPPGVRRRQVIDASCFTHLA